LANKHKPAFDPNSFLAKVGEGRALVSFASGETVFAQGDAADAIFYI
jgi:CRP-like cAMP-binding protein